MLGAGLDSFANRSHLAGQVRVFEIDHPATQEWKRRIRLRNRLEESRDIAEIAARHLAPPARPE